MQRAAWITEALLEYFTFQNFFTDRTLFAGVQAAAGRHLPDRRRRRRHRRGPHRYWDYHFAEPDDCGGR